MTAEEEQEHRLRDLSLLYEVSRSVSASLDLEEVLDRVVRGAVEAVGADAASLNILVEPGRAQMMASLGLSERFKERTDVRPTGTTMTVVNTGKPLLIPHVAEQPDLVKPMVMDEGIKSFIVLPLPGRERVIGAMFVFYRQEHSFSDDEVHLLTTIANQAAVAIENARLFEEERRRAAQLAVVNEVGRHAISTLKLDEILYHVTTAIQTGFGYYNVAAFLVEGEHAVMKAIAGGFAPVAKEGYRQHLSQGIVGWVITHGQTVLANDVSRDPHFIPAFLGEEGLTRSELCVPMRVDGAVIGALDVTSVELNAFDQGDAMVLEIISGQVAMACKNALAYGRLDEERGRLETVYEVAADVNSSLNLDEILARAIESITTRLGGTAGYVFLLEPGTDRLRPRAVTGLEVPLSRINEILDMHLGEGLVGWVALHNQPAVVSDILQDERWLYVDEFERGIRSAMSVPLVRGGEMLGALCVLHPTLGFFGEAHCRLLTATAQQVTVAVANARLHETVQEQARLDSLTQVYNHGELIRRLHVAVEEAAREDQPVSLIMLDIDYFKGYNDRYGHVTGDLILKAVVQAIRANIMRTDVVGRWGGEEFGIILPRTDTARTRVVAERIRRTLATMPLTDDKSREVPKPTVSQGIATYRTTAKSAEELIDRADAALYRAKAKGRDQIAS
ncbi:MAG: sensor domain-containing diguanylate cyclase [Chloroflexota bacterium]